jgi:hypothetical protein
MSFEQLVEAGMRKHGFALRELIANMHTDATIMKFCSADGRSVTVTASGLEILMNSPGPNLESLANARVVAAVASTKRSKT